MYYFNIKVEGTKGGNLNFHNERRRSSKRILLHSYQMGEY